MAESQTLWYCEIRVNYITFTPLPLPSFLIRFGGVSVLTALSPSLCHSQSQTASNLSFFFLSLSLPIWLHIHFIQFLFMYAPTLIWLSQAMTVSVLTCNKAAYKGRKNGECVCVCVGRGGRGTEATKLVTAQHSTEPRTSPLLDLCPWQMQSLPFVSKVCVCYNGGDLEWIGRRRGDKVQ